MKRYMLVLLVAAGLCSVMAEAEIIRLKNGMVLQCEILESSEEQGITVKRLDNGGVVSLRWDHILEADLDSLKYSLGYTSEEAKPVMLRVTRVWLRNGTFEDGIKEESDRAGTIRLRRRGKPIYLMQNQVTSIETVEAEAKDVFTLEELYLQKLNEGVAETARDYFNLAVYCESITFYERANEVYQAVKTMDPEFKPEVIQQKINMMELKIREADATAMLDEVKQLIYRRKFAYAMERLDEFEVTFPDSVQIADKERLKSETLVKRHAFYQQKILTDYFTYMERVARKVAANKEVTLEAALDFAAEEMGPAIRQKLADDIYEIPMEEVEELWLTRKGGAPRTASYGTGTFILGPERAKMIPEKVDEKEKEEEEEEAEVKTTDQRLKKALEELKKQRVKYSSQKRSRIRVEDIGRSPEEWWATETTTNRQNLIVAFYAEESGDMKILKVWLNQCNPCNGKGWLEKLSTSGEKDQKFPCEVCKTLGVERTIRFK